MPTVDPFERTARKVRRSLRAVPILEPLANRAGIWLWRRHLLSIVEELDLALPRKVRLDPQLVRRRLPPARLPENLQHQIGSDSPAVAAGRWDLQATLRSSETAPYADGGSVVIAFDRAGRACLVSGERELQKALKEEHTVLARVALRHKRWARLALEVMAYARQRGGRAYQPYLHPDLAAIPSEQAHERFQLLRDALPVDSGTLLDLGANAGYFSHRFEQAGFDCIAVERSEKEAYFLNILRRSMERRFEIFKGSLTDFPLPQRVDVVLALNIFHHFLKTESSFIELRAFLRRLETRYMLFESHLPEDPQMASAAHDFQPDAFARFIAETSGLDRVQRLGAAADNRPLFLLSAKPEVLATEVR